MSVARVFVNQIEVGTLPAEQYYALVKAARRSRRIWIAQGLNLVATMLRIGVAMLRMVPFAWFVMVVVALGVAPDDLAAVINSVKVGSAEEVVGVLRQAVVIGATLTGVAITGSMAFGGHTYGYVSRFDEFVGQRLRELMEVPAEGDVFVIVRDVAETLGDVQ